MHKFYILSSYYRCCLKSWLWVVHQYYQWCLRMLLVIKWYQFVRNDDVRRQTKQPKLTAIIQSRWFTLFGHIMRMDDNADAKRILLASPAADWRRQVGRPRITWLSTIQQDLKQHHLTLPEAADLVQNRVEALRNRELHARNDDDDYQCCPRTDCRHYRFSFIADIVCFTSVYIIL